MHLRTIALLVSLLTLGLASSASAAVTDTTITSPADPTNHVSRDGSTPLQVTGVAPGAANGDEVELRCYRRVRPGDPDYYNWGTATVTDEAFSKTIDPDRPYVPCTLYAVPTSFPGDSTNLTGKTGPRIRVDNLVRYTNPADGLFDFQASRLIGNRFMAAYSVGSCGVCDAGLYDAAAGQASNHPYWGNVALYNQSDDDTRASMRIDGRNAYPTHGARQLPDSPPGGLPEMTLSEETAADGSWIVRETTRPKRCSKTTWPITSGDDCGSLEGTGVELQRTIRQTAERITVEDVWRSLDGQQHTLDLRYYHAHEGDGTPVHRPSWTNEPFQELEKGDRLTNVPEGERTVFFDMDSASPNDSFDHPQGAVTSSPAPSEVRFDGNDTTSWELAFARVVPAGGAIAITQDLLMGQTEAEVKTLAAKSEDRLGKPTVSIDSPDNNATVTTSTVKVTGKAADSRSLSLKVNGNAVPVGADGTWSMDMALQPGVNQVTAVASDGAGNEARTVRSFLFTPPPPPFVPVADVVAPSISRASLSASMFRVGSGATAVSAQRRRPAGTTIRYSVSEASRVTFAIARRTTGRRVGSRCVRSTRRNRSRRKCTRFVAGRTLTRRAPAGANQLRFTGRVGTRKLGVGRYRFAIVATDAAGNRSRPRLLPFRIVRR